MKVKSSLDSIDRVGAKLSAKDFQEFLRTVAEAFPSGTEEYEFMSGLATSGMTDVELVKKLFSLLGEPPKIDDTSPYGFSWELLAPTEVASAVFKKMEELDPESAHDLYEFMSYVHLNYQAQLEEDERNPAEPEPEPAPEPESKNDYSVDDTPPFEREDFAGLHSSGVKITECSTIEEIEAAVPGLVKSSGLTEADLAGYVDSGGPVVVFSTEQGTVLWHPKVGFVDSGDNDLTDDDVQALFGSEIGTQLLASVPDAEIIEITSASGSTLDKLLQLFQRIVAGQVKDTGMIGLGFNLRDAFANDIERIIPTMSARLGLKIVVEDVMKVLGEMGYKSITELVQAYLTNRQSSSDQVAASALPATEAHCREIAKSLRRGSVVHAVGRAGLPRQHSQGGRREGKATVIQIKPNAEDITRTRVVIRWSEDGIEEEIPLNNVRKISSSKDITGGAALVLLSSFRNKAGQVSFVVTGFQKDKNSYAQAFCGKMSLPEAEFQKLGIKSATRPYSGKDLPILAKKFARVDFPVTACRHPRIARTFVSQTSALLLRSSAYGMYAVRVPVVYSAKASSYTLFKKIGASYVSETGHRFKAVMAAKFGKPRFLMVAANSQPYFATKGKVTCNAIGAIDRTVLISQRRAVSQSIAAQRQAVQAALKDKDAVIAQAAEVTTKLAEAQTRIEAQTKTVEALNAQILSSRQSGLSAGGAAPDTEAEVRSGRRVSRLADLMSKL